MTLRIASLPLLAALACATGLHAQTNLISNGDFETGAATAISEGGSGYYTPNGAIPTDWSGIDGSGTIVATIGAGSYGYYDPQESSDGNYPGTSTSGVVGTMSGPDVFYAAGVDTGSGLYQASTATLSTTTDLDLTVALGMRTGESPMGNLQFEIVAVNNSGAIQDVLASGTYTSTAALGSFADSTLNYVYSSTNSADLNDTIAIELLKAPGGGADIDFDNVRLDAVPEPRTYALLAGVAAIGAVVLGRRRLSAA